MIHIAAWAILDNFGRRIVKLRWSEEAHANNLLAHMREKSPKSGFYLQKIVEPLSDYPSTLTVVLVTDKRISGTSIHKKTGEERRWSKVFHHIETTALVEGRHLLVEHFVSHRHKGEIRVNGPCGPMDYEEFEAWAKIRWPKGWEQVLVRLDG